MNDLPLFAQPSRIDLAALCDDDERAVARILNTREGAGAAMKVAEVAAAAGMGDRKAQSIVRHLIVDHAAPIGTSSRAPHGWYLVATRAEHEAVVALHRARALSELQTMAAHSRRAVRDLMAEVQTELLEEAEKAREEVA